MSELQAPGPRFSAVVPVGTRVDDDLVTLIAAYADAFESVNVSYELIVVLDGQREDLLDTLRPLLTTNRRIRVVQLSRRFGDSAALMAGFSEAHGELFVTLPAYYQVDVSELSKLLEAFQADDEMLIAVRWPRRTDSLFDKFRRGLFHGLFKYISRMDFRDLGCGVRILRRAVVSEIPLYGDQHRFLPALAARRGFRVREAELRQSPRDHLPKHYRLREYLHRLLDILTVFFLVRFTKKPLRFFGTVGSIAAGIGTLSIIVLVVQRLFFGVGLADRPALVLASLLIVLGVQTFALGLIGELIIFTHASEMKEYAIRRIIQSSDSARPASVESVGTGTRAN